MKMSKGYAFVTNFSRLSVRFRYVSQPTCQAALAFALAKDDEYLWNYAMKKCKFDRVDFAELAAFSSSASSMWRKTKPKFGGLYVSGNK